MIHKLQLGVSVGVLTAVWSNLFVNYQRLQILKRQDEER